MAGRLILVAMLLAAGCMPPTPLGVYRLPLQTGPEELKLTTVLAQLEGDELVLMGAVEGTELGRGRTQTNWMSAPMPYPFGKLGGYELTLYLRDGVLEDVEPRPWQTQPLSPLGSEDSVKVSTLESGTTKMAMLSAGGLIFSESERSQPASDAVPDPLEVLGSVSGSGLVLREDAGEGAEWKDAVSALIPLAPEQKMPCGRELRSIYRSAPGEVVKVPAGAFEAVLVTEIVDVCPGSKLEPTVWKVERWFAPGLGPVRMRATLSDGRARDYALAKTNVSSGDGSLWPLSEGNTWSYSVTNADGVLVSPSVQVRVSESLERSFTE